MRFATIQRAQMEPEIWFRFECDDERSGTNDWMKNAPPSYERRHSMFCVPRINSCEHPIKSLKLYECAVHYHFMNRTNFGLRREWIYNTQKRKKSPATEKRRRNDVSANHTRAHEMRYVALSSAPLEIRSAWKTKNIERTNWSLSPAHIRAQCVYTHPIRNSKK